MKTRPHPRRSRGKGWRRVGNQSNPNYHWLFSFTIFPLSQSSSNTIVAPASLLPFLFPTQPNIVLFSTPNPNATSSFFITSLSHSLPPLSVSPRYISSFIASSIFLTGYYCGLPLKQGLYQRISERGWRQIHRSEHTCPCKAGSVQASQDLIVTCSSKSMQRT